MYMKRLGRFPTPDPITRNFPSLSPYQYAGNSPIQSSDIDGLEQGAPAGYSGLMGVPTLVHAQDAQIQGTIIVQYQKLNAHANTTSLAAQNASNAVFLANQKKAAGVIKAGSSAKEKALNSMGNMERYMVQYDPVTKAVATGGLAVTGGALAGEAIGAAIPALTEVSVGGTTIAEGLGGAMGDAFAQGITTGKVNITQSAAQFGGAFLRNPLVSSFGSAGAGAALPIEVGSGGLNFDNRLQVLGGTKSLEKFGLETAIGGLGNLAASSGAGFLSGTSPYQPASYSGKINMSFFTNIISNAGVGVAGQAVQEELQK